MFCLIYWRRSIITALPMHLAAFHRIKLIIRCVLRCKNIGSHCFLCQSLLLSTAILNKRFYRSSTLPLPKFFHHFCNRNSFLPFIHSIFITGASLSEPHTNVISYTVVHAWKNNGKMQPHYCKFGKVVHTQ